MRALLGRFIEWLLGYDHVVRFVSTSSAGLKPARKHLDDAGYDMYCSQDVTIPPMGYGNVPVNVRCEFPEGVYCLIKGRSSTFRSRGLIVTDSVIDSGYRGEMFACVYNTKDFPITVLAGERISQIVPFRTVNLEFKRVSALNPSDRGLDGFGSTGS